MDLNPHLGGNIYYKQIGTDRFIIEYLNVCSNSAFNPVTFQIVLKSNGEIYLRYKNFMNYVDTGNRGPYTAIRSYVGQPERINLTWSPSNNNNYTSWLFSPLKLVTTTSNGSIISSAARTINIKRTFSIYLKNVSGSGVVKYTLDGGVTWNSQNITSSWARYAFPSTTNRHKVGLKFETNGDIFQIWGAQLEEGGIVTDYIETDTFLRSRETIYSETPLNILGAINSDDAVDKSFIEFKVFKNGPLVGSRSLYSGPIINGRQSWGDINDNGDCIYFASSIQKWIFQYNHGDLLSQNSYSTSDASDPISCKWVVNKNDAIDNFVLNWGINRYSSNGIIDGGTCSVSGMSQVVSNVQSAIKYSVNCNRTASYSLSNKNSKKMFLDAVEKQLDISSTDLPSLIDYAGFQLNSNLGITLKNSSNIIGAIITMNTGSELLSQQFSVAESDILNTNVTIKEIIK